MILFHGRNCLKFRSISISLIEKKGRLVLQYSYVLNMVYMTTKTAAVSVQWTAATADLIQWNLGPRSFAVSLLPLLAMREVRGKYTSFLLARAGQRQKVEAEQIVTLAYAKRA